MIASTTRICPISSLVGVMRASAGGRLIRSLADPSIGEMAQRHQAPAGVANDVLGAVGHDSAVSFLSGFSRTGLLIAAVSALWFGKALSMRSAWKSPSDQRLCWSPSN